MCLRARASERQRRGPASRAGRRATAATPSFGSVAPAKVAGSLLFVSGAYGTHPDECGDADTLPIRGQLGADLTVAEGQASARLVAVNLLAMARAVLGTLDRVQSVVRLVGYINAAPGFVEAPQVLDGASRLLIDLFGAERGSHARMALYQTGLPGNAPLTAELLLEVDESPHAQAPNHIKRRLR